MKHELSKVLKILPTDYTDYGGEVKRWEDPNKTYPDCSNGCKFFVPLNGDLGNDWGVCSNPKSARAGLLTWEHQTGVDCFTPDDPSDGEFVDAVLVDEKYSKSQQKRLETLKTLNNWY